MAPGAMRLWNFTCAKCSVRPMASVSTSTWRVAPISAAEELVEPLLALAAQQGGALLDDALLELRHALGGRAGARREGEDVKIGEAAVIDDA